MTLTHNLTKQWQCNNYFNATITIVLVTSQKRHRVVNEIPGVFSGRAILEIIAREGHTKHVIALCFQPIKTFDFTQTCNIYIYIYISHRIRMTDIFTCMLEVFKIINKLCSTGLRVITGYLTLLS